MYCAEASRNPAFRVHWLDESLVQSVEYISMEQAVSLLGEAVFLLGKRLRVMLVLWLPDKNTHCFLASRYIVEEEGNGLPLLINSR